MWPLIAKKLERGGVPVRPSHPAATAAEAATALEALGVPLVARPLAPTGEYCAFVAEHPADVELAFLRARTQSPEKAAVLQAAPQGRIVTLSALRVEGGWELFPAVEVKHLAKHALTPVEFTCPPDGGAEIPAHTLSAVFDVLESLDPSVTGIAIDFEEAPEGATALFAREITALDTHVEAALAYAENEGAACVCFLRPQTGVIERVDGIAAAEELEGVVAVEIAAKPGDTVRHLTSISNRDAIGLVVAVAATPAEARARAHAAAASVCFTTTPLT